MTVALFLALTIFGALGAVVAAALQWPPSAFGAGIALAFAGFAGACGSAAVALQARGDLTEPRHRNGPTAPAPLPAPRIARPVFGRMWFAALGAFGVLALVPVISLARKPGRSTFTGWRRGVRLVDEDQVPIRADTLADGGATTAFPYGAVGSPDSPAILVRAVGVAGSADGYLAFSKVCTHAGCPVALYRHESRQLICPCHQSIFDVTDHAKNLSGPAARPLPALPIAIDAGGYLVALGDFDGPVGPDDWDRVL